MNNIMTSRMYLTNNCENCNHRDVCKYKDNYPEIPDNIKAPFSVKIECNYFSTSNNSIFSGGGISCTDTGSIKKESTTLTSTKRIV